MATAGISAKNLSDAEHGVQLRRAVVASTVGSVIESYDFLLYVLIAPLVFAKLYFPSSDRWSERCKRSASTPSALYPARSARHFLAITATASGARRR